MKHPINLSLILPTEELVDDLELTETLLAQISLSGRFIVEHVLRVWSEVVLDADPWVLCYASEPPFETVRALVLNDLMGDYYKALDATDLAALKKILSVILEYMHFKVILVLEDLFEQAKGHPVVSVDDWLDDRLVLRVSLVS